MWKDYENGYTIGTIGSEQGIIIKDEQFNECCRITIEKCEKYYAITCGIYGLMCHTTFVDEEEYIIKYNEMKKDLQTFLNYELNEEETNNFIENFTYKY